MVEARPPRAADREASAEARPPRAVGKEATAEARPAEAVGAEAVGKEEPEAAGESGPRVARPLCPPRDRRVRLPIPMDFARSIAVGVTIRAPNVTRGAIATWGSGRSSRATRRATHPRCPRRVLSRPLRQAPSAPSRRTPIRTCLSARTTTARSVDAAIVREARCIPSAGRSVLRSGFATSRVPTVRRKFRKPANLATCRARSAATIAT